MYAARMYRGRLGYFSTLCPLLETAQTHAHLCSRAIWDHCGIRYHGRCAHSRRCEYDLALSGDTDSHERSHTLFWRALPLDIKRFLGLHGIALVLLLSWLIVPTRMMWDMLDHTAFHMLNSWVQTSPFWQKFWALASYKRAEWVMDGVRLIFFAALILTIPRGEKRTAIAKILFTIGFIFAVIMLVGKTLFPDILQIERLSPTASIDGAFRLSSVIDWIYVKDHSRASFPSDHGITACLFISCMFALFGRKWGYAAIVTEGCYCLPRLVAGAHWLSDVLIGSGMIALILSAWMFTTPIARLFIRGFEFLLGRKYVSPTVRSR